MYLAARAWGIQPSEFWDMTMGEFLLEAGHHIANAPKRPGVLSEKEKAELLAFAGAV